MTRITGFSRGIIFAALTLTLLTKVLHAEAAPEIAGFSIEGTELNVEMSDGTIRTGPDLIGAKLTIADKVGNLVLVRIDGAQRDTVENGGRWLFALKVQDADTGEWGEFCGTGPDGLKLGFPVAGRATPSGGFELSDETFTISCTAGAVAKCIRMGYVPWDKATDGTPLLDHFRACTRMVRADYCGVGEPHTVDGTLVNIFDRLGIQKSETSDDMFFEAGWGPDGATCVAKTRREGVLTLDQLQGLCGARFEGRIGDDCNQERAISTPGTLVFNESRISQ